MARLISHAEGDSHDLAAAIAAAEQRIASAGPEYGTGEQLRADLAAWQESELGRWMLVNHGWNAYWTRYCIGYDRDPDAKLSNPVEDFFLNSSPAVLATRARWGIMSQLAAGLVTADTVAMSVPCGLMDDLIRLPEAPTAAALIGLDLDAEALAQAAENADQHDATNCTFAHGDAWAPHSATVVSGDAAVYQRAVDHGVDVLMSNGLNIYVADDDEVVELYRAFRSVVRPGGTLIVSALTTQQEWDLTDTPLEDSRRSLGLSLINDVQWANYRSVDTTVTQLAAAGFAVQDVRYDPARIFPAFVAS